MRKLFFSAVILLSLLGLPALSQEKSVRPDINVPFQNPNAPDYLKKFEIESREVYANRKEIVALCKIKPGMAVADIGAGTGLFTRMFAKEVGPTGKVYAVDIAKPFLEYVAKSSKDEGFKNVETVQCDQFSCKLPENSVDAVFICDTYHHFEFPQRTLASIHKALKPGGQMLVIDFKRIPGVTSEKMLKHVRAGQEVFTAEIRDAGFKQLDEMKLLKDNYFIRFEKKELTKEKK
jgi:ubiquinone/menaquinone biosynthesis C-methylase UbiE